MQRIEIRDLYKTYEKYSDKSITVCGWARTVRDSKNIAFIELNDGAFKSVQVVVEREKNKNYDEIVKCNVGSSFKVVGKLIVTPNAQQPFEINANSVEILGVSDTDYPLQKSATQLNFCAQFLPFVRAEICLMRCLEFVQWQRLLFTNFSTSETLCI